MISVKSARHKSVAMSHKYIIGAVIGIVLGAGGLYGYQKYQAKKATGQ